MTVEPRKLVDDVTKAYRAAIWMKIFVAVIAAAGSGLLMPSATLLVYCLAFNLPYFEIVESFGEHGESLFVICAGMTLLATALLLLPGYFKMKDPHALPDRIDGWSSDDIANHTLRRWVVTLGWSFLVGYAASMYLSWNDGAGRRIEYVTAAFAGLAFYACLFAVGILRRGRPDISKIEDQALREKLAKPFRSYIGGVGIIGLLSGLMYGYIGILIAKFFKEGLESLPESPVNIIEGFLSGVFAVGLYFIFSYWGARRSISNTVAATAFCFIMIIGVYPTAGSVVGNTLSMLGHGGGRTVILELNENVARAWPELLSDKSDRGEHPYRTKELPVILLAKTKIFIALPDPSGARRFVKNGPLFVIERSDLRGMAFVR